MKYLCRIIIAAAMVMLTGCSKPEQIGGPYMLFEIHGTVMDEAGNPIEGIEVSAGQSDIVKTNVNGRFSFHGRSAPMTYAILTFEDKEWRRIPQVRQEYTDSGEDTWRQERQLQRKVLCTECRNHPDSQDVKYRSGFRKP